MAKEVAGLIKLQIKGGAANPSPPGSRHKKRSPLRRGSNTSGWHGCQKADTGSGGTAFDTLRSRGYA